MKRIWIAVVLLAIVGLGVWAADELAITQGSRYDKDGRKSTQPTATVRHDISGDGVIENIQSVSTNTAGDALVLGGVTNPGFASFENIGPSGGVNTNESPATNWVEVGCYDANTNFVAFLSLNTNQSAQTWLATATPRARATGTNTVRVSYIIVDR